MTDEEWLEVFDLLWRQCWMYGTQNDRRELLVIKARIEARQQPLGTPLVPTDKPD